MSDLFFDNKYQFKQLKRNDKTAKDIKQSFKTNTIQKHLDYGVKQPKEFDYPYMNNLFNLYGKAKYEQKGLIGTPYNSPLFIRPPNHKFDNKSSSVLDSFKHQYVDVSGYKYKLTDLPLPKPKKIS